MKNIFTLLLALTCSHFIAIGSPLHLSTVSPEFAQFRTNVYAIGSSGSTNLIDGTLTQYDTGYSNNIDGLDARKLSNPGENFGMPRHDTVLIIERRHIFQNRDTIFFKMWNMRAITYKLEMVASNLNVPGRTGVLEDRYLHTGTVLSLDDTTNFSFTVTSDPASHAPDRFMVVFGTPTYGTLPLTFTSIQAIRQSNTVKIDWATANESNIKHYDIEKSATGFDFTKVSQVDARNSAFNSYEWVDMQPSEGYNFYRLRSTTPDGKTSSTDIIKLYFGNRNSSINIYPNPVTGTNLKLQMTNQQPGIYEIKLINSFGQSVMTKSLTHAAGRTVENLPLLSNIPKGIYRLEIKTPSGEKKIVSVLF